MTGFLRRMREISENAEHEIRSEPGPEFKDFEFEDLHPKTLTRRHLPDGDDGHGLGAGLGLGLGLGLEEIRGALDPRTELTEVADAVREAADTAPPSRDCAARPVSPAKPGQPAAAARPAFGRDAS